jgi:polyferredoxin
MKKMRIKTKALIQGLVRFTIQVAFFLLFPSLFSAAFSGLRSLADAMRLHKAFSWNPFLTILLFLLVFTILSGRFFCAFACSFGSVGDWMYACSAAVQKRIFKKVFVLPDKLIHTLQYLKYLVLVVLLAACLTGYYFYLSPTDPWEAFASLRALRFDFSGPLLYATISLGFIALGMLVVERFFCQFLCPLGAVFTLLPSFPALIYDRNKETCPERCDLCKRACPAHLYLGEEQSRYGECFQCGKCGVRCPRGNVGPCFGRLQGMEPLWLVVVETILFMLTCYLVINI